MARRGSGFDARVPVRVIDDGTLDDEGKLGAIGDLALALDELEDRVLEIAERVAKIPTDLQQLNKRTVHRAMEIMGMRAAIRAGTEIQALGFHTRSARDYLKKIAENLNSALEERDKQFGDFRGREEGKSKAE